MDSPDVGMVNPENDPDQPRTVCAYDSHTDPALIFCNARSGV
jgi:adenine-specific DNA-methyltransferase